MNGQLIGVDAPEWRALRSDTIHDVYDAPAYASLSAWQEGGEAIGVLVNGEDGQRLLIPLILRDIDSARRDAASPYGYPGVLTDARGDDAFVGDAMTVAVETLRKAGIVSLFIRTHPLIPVAGIDRVGTMVHHQTVAIDLSLSPEELQAQMRTNHRRDIKKGLQCGPRFLFSRTDACLNEFVRLYQATMERLDAAEYYRFDQEYFERLLAISEDIHIATVRIDGSVAAAGLITESCGIVQWHLSAADQRFASHRPQKLLCHSIRTWATERGDRWFHLGGGRGSAEDSLFHFKAGFSEYRADFGTLRVVVNEEDYDALVAEHSPDTGPADVTCGFPAYRRRAGIVAAHR